MHNNVLVSVSKQRVLNRESSTVPSHVNDKNTFLEQSNNLKNENNTDSKICTIVFQNSPTKFLHVIWGDTEGFVSINRICSSLKLFVCLRLIYYTYTPQLQHEILHYLYILTTLHFILSSQDENKHINALCATSSFS